VNFAFTKEAAKGVLIKLAAGRALFQIYEIIVI